MTAPHWLPESARDIAEVIGVDGLLRLVNAYGGTTIRVPGRHGLERVLTPQQHRDFVHTYRNLSLYIPRLPGLKRLRALELAEMGCTRAAIARELGVSERTVYQWLAEAQAGNQLDLFAQEDER